MFGGNLSPSYHGFHAPVIAIGIINAPKCGGESLNCFEIWLFHIGFSTYEKIKTSSFFVIWEVHSIGCPLKKQFLWICFSSGWFKPCNFSRILSKKIFTAGNSCPPRYLWMHLGHDDDSPAYSSPLIGSLYRPCFFAVCTFRRNFFE